MPPRVTQPPTRAEPLPVGTAPPSARPSSQAAQAPATATGLRWAATPPAYTKAALLSVASPMVHSSSSSPPLLCPSTAGGEAARSLRWAVEWRRAPPPLACNRLRSFEFAAVPWQKVSFLTSFSTVRYEYRCITKDSQHRTVQSPSRPSLQGRRRCGPARAQRCPRSQAPDPRGAWCEHCPVFAHHEAR
jgi:hypothetical protein